MLFPIPGKMRTCPSATQPALICLLAFATFFLAHISFTSAQQATHHSGLISVHAWNNTPNNNETLAPYVHNVTGTYTWILPREKYDIGAGSMMCECFDPVGTHSSVSQFEGTVADTRPLTDGCCMPTSKTIAPFCVVGNATCCGDTYCSAGETCCGGACCPSVSKLVASILAAFY